LALRNLIPKPAIQARIKSMAREIEQALALGELDVLILLKGAFLFGSDLVRNLEKVQSVHFAQPKSYRGDAKTAGQLEWHGPQSLENKAPTILILDEILDTGATLARAKKEMQSSGFDRVLTAVLLRKNRPEPPVIEADFVGFEIPDHFVVGFGLDYGEKFRHLDGIFILEPEEALHDR
jgi:hypoxanthine phosphoribosyltransferase